MKNYEGMLKEREGNKEAPCTIHVGDQGLEGWVVEVGSGYVILENEFDLGTVRWQIDLTKINFVGWNPPATEEQLKKREEHMAQQRAIHEAQERAKADFIANAMKVAEQRKAKEATAQLLAEVKAEVEPKPPEGN